MNLGSLAGLVAVVSTVRAGGAVASAGGDLNAISGERVTLIGEIITIEPKFESVTERDRPSGGLSA